MRHVTFPIVLAIVVALPTVAPGQTTIVPNSKIAAFTPPSIMRDGFKTVPLDDLELKALIDLRVYDITDNWIGEVSGLIRGASRRPIGAVVDVGGFLGMGERSVAIRLDSLTVLQNIEGDRTRLYLAATDAALDALPEYDS
ncbi:PRC-barrel domain-containing protein [Rhodobacteraceae bacterium KMM 6894]|nr:PRC-barrel domain-containing protein [Rhodobacteraceae bacterium KMM 6894]